MKVEEGMMEWWNNGRLGREEDRIQQTGDRRKRTEPQNLRGQRTGG
jgi:hypothetical protein